MPGCELVRSKLERLIIFRRLAPSFFNPERCFELVQRIDSHTQRNFYLAVEGIFDSLIQRNVSSAAQGIELCSSISETILRSSRNRFYTQSRGTIPACQGIEFPHSRNYTRSQGIDHGASKKFTSYLKFYSLWRTHAFNTVGYTLLFKTNDIYKLLQY